MRQWPLWLVTFFAIVMFVLQCVSLGDARIDDAFITFSSSKNLALGNGPVYSHGVRVEGYSTFLWMVLVALPLVVTRGAAPLASARVMGAPFAALLGIFFSSHARCRAAGPAGAPHAARARKVRCCSQNRGHNTRCMAT